MYENEFVSFKLDCSIVNFIKRCFRSIFFLFQGDVSGMPNSSFVQMINAIFACMIKEDE